MIVSQLLYPGHAAFSASGSGRGAEWPPRRARTGEQAKQFSPSAARNVGPITDRLAERLEGECRALEIASGTGQHIVAFARAFQGVDWTPSDPHPEARASIAARVAESGLANLHPPLALDVTTEAWWQQVSPGLGTLVAINLLHISPWAATEGLLAGARRLLAPNGRVFIYGCFKRDGRHLSESNVTFDASLRHRDPRWGVRAVEDVAEAAAQEGFRLNEVIDMPANNLMLVLGRV